MSACTPSTEAIDPTSLNAEQQRAHHNAIRNFVLSGAERLAPPKRALRAIQNARLN